MVRFDRNRFCGIPPPKATKRRAPASENSGKRGLDTLSEAGHEVEARQPLDGIKVLDFSQVMAGPYCCMLLGDMGADVIKVEPPGAGDQARRSMEYRLKGEDSPGFLALNRNKRSIALNLKSEAGRRGAARTRQDRRRGGREWAAGRRQAPRHRLRDASRHQSAPGLCQHLGLRPDGTLGGPAGLRPDRPGNVGRDQRHRPARAGAGQVGRALRRSRRRHVRALRHPQRADRTRAQRTRPVHRRLAVRGGARPVDLGDDRVLGDRQGAADRSAPPTG